MPAMMPALRASQAESTAGVGSIDSLRFPDCQARRREVLTPYSTLNSQVESGSHVVRDSRGVVGRYGEGKGRKAGQANPRGGRQVDAVTTGIQTRGRQHAAR